ncbi:MULTISPECIES: hypothetical protein [Dermacoccus]|uniref:BatC protein n=2 Tax=Dermacoccus TaxID=57495 RepID=A0ABN2B8H3_9MICO|nr:hypothetical protein [Dermacoccus abyssi]
MSDNENETFKPEVDQQDGGPGAQTGGDGGEYNDTASGGQSDAGSKDEGQHGDADNA